MDDYIDEQLKGAPALFDNLDGPVILHNTGDMPAVIECKHIVNFAIDKGWELQLV